MTFVVPGTITDSDCQPSNPIKLFLTDPPYNIGHDYGPVDDNRPENEYHEMLEEVFDTCYDLADDNSSLVIIHYPEALAKMWPILTKKWRFHQWITWVYPSNIGHSKSKWTNASRAILWLVKGNPDFYGDRVTQPYKNPTDKRIKKLIESGKTGTNLYNWWEINMCKNVSRDKKDYANQIPEELLRRVILCTTNEEDWVADPFAGTFSTCSTAISLDRNAWGCDLNPRVAAWIPTQEEDE
tara:strand:- start:279 stop:998 length:720 start_codon:yes stop_codon:yes gene_type:complete